ncbi:MAG: hypothetical protein ACK5PF_12050 [bacterium]|jgi:hypothetical protein|nr:hypothetical protein [Curvibacter sp.]
MESSTLGLFVLETARGNKKTSVLPEKQAKEVRDQLSERVSEKVEQIRALQRRAYENAKAVTVF